MLHVLRDQPIDPMLALAEFFGWVRPANYAPVAAVQEEAERLVTQVTANVAALVIAEVEC
jgi:hypothetical protein|eukprot:6467805-Prymnesium_polylepis.1